MNDQEFDIYELDNNLHDLGYKYVCGVDEAGRGPLAGPCVVCACILPEFERIEGINDSKQLTKKKREELYKIIVKKAIAYKVIYVKEKEIDQKNIYQATKDGMIKAINSLKVKPDYVITDAMPIKDLGIHVEDIIHGDAKSASVAAASIIAKVVRDNYMDKMDIKYPNYGFSHNKGYCTKMHMDALEEYGPTPIHRKTYYPVSKYFSGMTQLSIFDDVEEKSEE